MFAVLDKEKNTELHSLDLHYIDLSTVDPDVLARVVVKLKNINLSDTGLSPHQVETMFAVLDMEKNTELHNLNLCSIDLSTVDPHVMARHTIPVPDPDISPHYCSRVHLSRHIWT